VGDFRFRLADTSDAQEIVALLNATFRTPVDVETWNWYTRKNPLGPSRVYLAHQPDGLLVGAIGFAPIRLRIAGDTFDCDFAHHLAVRPEYRDGLSYISLNRYALGAESRMRVKLAIGPPNRTAYPIHKKLMKWVDFGFLELMKKERPAAAKHDCILADVFTETFDEFYGCAYSRLEFCVAKNAQWMNWRFSRRPGAPYTIYTINDNQRLTGYIILKMWVEPDGYRKAHIVDLHAADGDVLHRLIRAAECYSAGANELNLWAVKGYPYREGLEELGFRGIMPYQPLIVRVFDATAAVYPDGECSFSYGDGDTLY
jgi:hypothetical protein